MVILAGTNDIAGNTGPSSLEMIEDNIRSMTELAQAHGIQVVLCSVLPAYDYPWREGKDHGAFGGACHCPCLADVERV